MLLSRRYIEAFAESVRPRHGAVVQLLAATMRDLLRTEPPEDEELENAQYRHSALRAEFVIESWLTESLRMQPVEPARMWSVTPIASTAELAQWLQISDEELAWFSGRFAHGQQSPPKTQHYHFRLTKKQSGGHRLIEAPQARLKAMQRKILAEILDRVPRCYDAAHGFVKGRSVKTFAAPHVGKDCVIRMDLRDFFPRIGRARVQAVFRTMGYPELVANALAGLCTNITPKSLFVTRTNSHDAVRATFDAKQLYCRPHLPQGAPTSPALANICAFRLDARLTGLADWAGATYTRYADDIAFSGDENFARHAARYSTEITVIAASEGWSVQHRKTRIMRQGVRQHLAGIVVNQSLNVPRADYDNLKATLVNCIRLGTETQNPDRLPNFRAHLSGCITYVAWVNPVRGQRLRKLFESIAW